MKFEKLLRCCLKQGYAIVELNINKGKKAAGEAAAELVQDGMTVGLGTGTTTTYFIKRLGERCQKGLKVSAVASSRQSEELAKEHRIPLVNIEDCISLEMTVDGADEIDVQKRMIKGGGGALLREKIVAAMSREMVVIVDSSKCVETIGAFPLPVEILPFAWKTTVCHLEKLALLGSLRKTKRDGSLYVTDNGNYIYDVSHGVVGRNLEELNTRLLAIPGVLETGFFFHLAGRVIVGYPDGHVELL